MSEKKRFRKQKLNSEDNKGMELAAKALKAVLGAATTVAVAVLVKSRQKLSDLNVAGQILKK